MWSRASVQDLAQCYCVAGHL
uniref:Uncharacterized protein n=1 Tax=Anguilla anguilla TaxID=7936 RepID=A0A0E9QP78_ANGAN